MLGCLLPRQSLGLTKERDFSSVLGRAMEMSVQLLNLHCPNFVLVCPNFIPYCCNLDAGVMFLVLVRGRVCGVSC